MALYALLSLDYEERGPSRANFYAHLSRKGWSKMGDVDTVWKKSHTHSPASDDTVELEIKSMMSAAATEFKPKRIDYVAQIGNNPPIERAFVRKVSGYDYEKK
ncbi:hypothetical protein PPUJ20066_00790 [Pseudomonas putida]|nr:hypothetical protein PPUJ20066_00790 [Pseudomonas putida]